VTEQTDVKLIVEVYVAREAQERAAREGKTATRKRVFRERDHKLVGHALDLGGVMQDDGVVHLKWPRGTITLDDRFQYSTRNCPGRPDTRALRKSPESAQEALGQIQRELERHQADFEEWLPKWEEEEGIKKKEKEERDKKKWEEELKILEEQRALARAYLADEDADDAPSTRALSGYTCCLAEPTDEDQKLAEAVADTKERRQEERRTRRFKRMEALLREHYADVPDVIERLDAMPGVHLGLVPLEEAKDLIRDVVLPVFDGRVAAPGLAAYEKLTKSDLKGGHEDCSCTNGSQHEYYPCDCTEFGHKSSFLVEDVEDEGITGEEWQRVKRTRALLLELAGVPEEATEIKLHAGTCDRCDSTARRVGLLVDMDVGDGVSVQREYGLVKNK
jgi:hypothetical protein